MLTWRFLIKLAMFIAIFDGALRKWAFPSLANELYFLKDVVLLVAYTAFLMTRDKENRPLPELRFLGPVLIVAGLFVTMQGFNPALGSVTAGIFGIRHYLIYVPLIFLVPRLFRNKEELLHFLWVYALTIIPVGLLGVAQFFSPANSILNTYVGEQFTVGFGHESRPRITGTFSYISGYTMYLLFVFALLVALATDVQRHLRRRIILIAALTLTVANMLMTGSRGPVFGSVLLLVAYFAIQAMSFSRAFAKMLPSLLVVFTFFIIGVFQSPAFDAFVARVEVTDTLSDTRLDPASQFEKFFDLFRYERAGGWGAGACHPALLALREKLELPPGEDPPELEDEPDRILAELGPLGFLLWYGVRIALLWGMWITLRRVQQPALRNLAIMMFALHLLTLPGQVIYHHTFGLYYWFTAGFIALLPKLEQEELAGESLSADEEEDAVDSAVDFEPSPEPMQSRTARE